MIEGPTVGSRDEIIRVEPIQEHYFLAADEADENGFSTYDVVFAVSKITLTKAVLYNRIFFIFYVVSVLFVFPLTQFQRHNDAKQSVRAIHLPPTRKHLHISAFYSSTITYPFGAQC